MRTVTGLATARGLAIGPAFVYRGEGEVQIPEYRIEFGREGDELLRLKRAHNETKRDLESLISVLRERTGRADVMVFECHLMILEDPILRSETERHITAERLNAEAAVRKTADNARAQFERMNDPYFRERVRDLDDVERRLLKALIGFAPSPQRELKVPSIVVADDLTPTETVQLPREFVLGFATNGGSTTSHVALLARAMGLPSVTGLGNVTELVKPGETLLLNGTRGTVTLSPDARMLGEFEGLVAQQRAISGQMSPDAPPGTLRDGGEVLLTANAHPGFPFDDIRKFGARGIGLYRSEYLWINRELEPSEDEQYAAYREVVEFAATLGDEAIVLRTLDIGGDKVVRGISAKEANPFLGNRSIRYLLSHPSVFKAQLRAILRASAHGRVKLMYPMISCVEELKAAAATLDEVRRELDAEGLPHDRNVAVGAMVEVPAAALNADALARHVDFLSIGTNDLVQYTMAADRGNDAVARLYQPTNPSVLKLVRCVIAAAKRCGIPVSVCGESAADPIVGVLWAAMGADSLSMSPAYIPVMSKILSRLTRSDLDEYANRVAELDDGFTAEEIMAECRAWMLGKIADLGIIAI